LKNLDPIATQQYIEKADHFLQAMKLAALELAPYRTGIALLAVLAPSRLTMQSRLD
jgi:hypothetical protein